MFKLEMKNSIFCAISLIIVAVTAVKGNSKTLSNNRPTNQKLVDILRNLKSEYKIPVYVITSDIHNLRRARTQPIKKDRNPNHMYDLDKILNVHDYTYLGPRIKRRRHSSSTDYVKRIILNVLNEELNNRLTPDASAAKNAEEQSNAAKNKKNKKKEERLDPPPVLQETIPEDKPFEFSQAVRETKPLVFSPAVLETKPLVFNQADLETKPELTPTVAEEKPFDLSPSVPDNKPFVLSPPSTGATDGELMSDTNVETVDKKHKKDVRNSKSHKHRI